jgi:hypothetical protein
MCKSIILQLNTHRQIPHPENPLILVILILTISFFLSNHRGHREHRENVKIICVYLRLSAFNL